jgi:hypothetical protein
MKNVFVLRRERVRESNINYRYSNKKEPIVEEFKVGDVALHYNKLVTVIKVVSRPFPFKVREENGFERFVHHESLHSNLAVERINKINSVID